ncbi:MAG: hypothetical protein NT148_01790 [Candidatus Nealsonbacteria bacterium]|nr:hypothetical protein [Candidatus Nealsonbacteria bacterium]
MNTGIKRIIVLVVVGVVLITITLLSSKLYLYSNEIVRLQKVEQERVVNSKILSFTKLFIEKVLASKTEVDFETRLKLENSIRDINDPELFDQWTKFTGSKESGEAQANVVILLQMLVSKISVN